jgi:hypothetical protein
MDSFIVTLRRLAAVISDIRLMPICSYELLVCKYILFAFNFLKKNIVYHQNWF